MHSLEKQCDITHSSAAVVGATIYKDAIGSNPARTGSPGAELQR